MGDGNNVCSTFIHAAARFDFRLTIACPRTYAPDRLDLARAAEQYARIEVTEDPKAAVRGADLVVADTWVSMGDEDRFPRLEALEPYRVDEALMGVAARDALFMHCLPAHRGEEVSAAVIDGPQSVIWDEAENRIHAQKAVLAWVFGATALRSRVRHSTGAAGVHLLQALGPHEIPASAPLRPAGMTI